MLGTRGATDAEMKAALQSIRKSQWRWDFAVASHGASFHAPQEVTRILAQSLGYAQEARLAVAKVLAKHGFTGDVPMPDISSKERRGLISDWTAKNSKQTKPNSSTLLCLNGCNQQNKKANSLNSNSVLSV